VNAATPNLTQVPAATVYVGTQTPSIPFTLTMNSQPVANTAVSLTYSASPGALTSSAPTSATTDADGNFTLDLTGQTTGAVTITATWDGTKTVTHTITVSPATYSIDFDNAASSFDFSGTDTDNKASGIVKVRVTNTSGGGSSAVSGATVTFSATMNDSPNEAIVSSRRNQFYGLTVNNSSSGGTSFPVASVTTDGNGEITLSFEDILGERTLTLKASVTPPGSSTITANSTVEFTKGPLAVFMAPVTNKTWDEAYEACNGDPYPGANHTDGWTTYAYVGGPGNKMPIREEYQAVSGGSVGSGAAIAAGWPDDGYWTGEAYGANGAFRVGVTNGFTYGYVLNYRVSVACRR
jgi:hypothetical protein